MAAIQIKCEIFPFDKASTDGSVYISFALTNMSDHPIDILKRNTPLEGLLTDCLEVMVNGERVPYDGRMVKRKPATDKDFITLQPGETVRNEINLSRAYPIPPNATIVVRFDIENLVLRDEGHQRIKKNFFEITDTEPDLFSVPGQFQTAASITAPTFGEEHRDDEDAESEESTLLEIAGVLKPPAFIRADDEMQEKITNAHEHAYKLAGKAIGHLQQALDKKFIEWFDATGADNRVKKVAQNFTDIKTRMERATFTYHAAGPECLADEYVYTTKDGRKIWLCTEFWAAPAKGVASKAGTLVHEHSHASASTDDHDYGEEECRQLAIDRPGIAIRNADNYEFYAETIK